MEIELRLYGALQKYRPPDAPESGSVRIAVTPSTTIADLIDSLGIPGSWVRSCFVNSEASKKDRILEDGDEVALLPPAGGGAAAV